MNEYLQLAKICVTKESVERTKKFKALAKDVIINTPPKCGTTWLQMICHSLRSKGDLSFKDIDEITPFVLFAYDTNIDPNKDQMWQPRVFKYHDFLNSVPKSDDVKYILCIRNPVDVAISHYYFVKDWILSDDVSLAEFTDTIYLQDEEPDVAGMMMIWHGILDFYPRRHDPNVLYLHYEDLKENLRESVKLIANFLELEMDEELIDLTVKQSDIKFMQKHHEKFEMKLVKKAVNRNLSLPSNAGMDGKNKGLVRKGKCGQTISNDIDKKFEKKWQKTIEKKLGFKSYNELRKATNKELNRPFYNNIYDF